MAKKTAEQVKQLVELVDGMELEQLLEIPAFSEILAAARSYTFNAIPGLAAKTRDARYWDVTVDYRGEDSYAIVMLGDNYNFRTKGWDMEGMTRTAAYKRTHRRPLIEAITVAKKLAVTIVGPQNMTAAGYALWVEETHPEWLEGSDS